jgi:opacity protein-like surface antigen
MSRVRVVLALAALAACSGAHAQWDETNWDVSEWNEPGGRKGGFYVDARGGAFLPVGSGMEGMKTGFAADVIFGALLDRSIGLGLGVGGLVTRSDWEAVAVPGVGVVTARATLTLVPITASTRFFLADGAFRPYLLAGAGVFLVELEGEARVAGASGSGSERETAFGWQTGAGARVQLSDGVSLTVDASYRAAKVGFDSGDVDLAGVSLAGGLGFAF